MSSITNPPLRIGCLLAIIATTLQTSIPASTAVATPNGGGEIEFRRAERWDTASPKIIEFVTEEFRGEKYRVAKGAELKVRRTELTEVIVRETQVGYYGIGLAVDQSLWSPIESMTIASLGGRLAIYVEGSLIFVGVVQSPIPDGRLFIWFGRRPKQEVFEIAKGFSDMPGFLPFKGTSEK